MVEGIWRGWERICQRRWSVGPLAWGRGEEACYSWTPPRFILFCICGDNPLTPLWVVADDNFRMDQGHASLCLRVGTEAGAAGLVILIEVNDFIQFGAHGRVAWTDPCQRRSCLRTVGFWRRDWGGFQYGGGAVERGRLGRGTDANETRERLYRL